MGYAYSAKAAAAAVDDKPTNPGGDPAWPDAWGFPPADGPNGPWPPGWPPALPITDRFITMAESSKDIDYSDDAGAAWAASALAGTGNPRFMIGSGSILYALRHDGSGNLTVDLSVDGGETWEERGNVVGAYGSTGGYARPLLSGTTLLILSQVSGLNTSVYRSTDGGKTFTSAIVFKDATYLYVGSMVQLANGDILVLLNKTGVGGGFKVYKSTDDGLTFGTAIATVANHESKNLVVASNGNLISVGVPIGGNYGVQVSTDSGVNWTTKVSVGGSFYSLAVSGNDVLTVKTTGEMYYSDDGGATWTAGDNFSGSVGTVDGRQMLWAYGDGWLFLPDNGAEVWQSDDVIGFGRVSGSPSNTPYGVFVIEV